MCVYVKHPYLNNFGIIDTKDQMSMILYMYRASGQNESWYELVQ